MAFSSRVITLLNPRKERLSMACLITRIENGFISANISGVMRLDDHKALQHIARQIIATGRKVRFLAILENFQGWEKGVDWSDIGFFVDHGNDIAKMAIVGDKGWREDVFAFAGKGLRATEIEYFTPDLLEEAEAWVHA